jgi:predicted alpha/beta superfamily hydrolase
MLRAHKLPDGRTVTVYLPPQYEIETERRYPVLYLQDGQNLFAAARAFGGRHWRVAETATALIEAGRVAPLIVAGVDHTERNRVNEYTPTWDRRRGGGKADDYARLLIETVKALVDTTYRTLPGAQHSGVGGSSLGGLVSLYLALRHPDVFGLAAVLSPSVWWDRRAILREVRKAGAQFATVPGMRPRLWVDMGTRESRGAGSARRVVEDARLLNNGLGKAGWLRATDLHYEEIEGGTHSEDAWGDRFGRVLEWLFPKL